MFKLRSAIALSLIVTHVTACVETADVGGADQSIATTLDPVVAPTDDGAPIEPVEPSEPAPPDEALPEVPEPTTLTAEPVLAPAVAAAGDQSCYAVQVQHFTYPDNQESSPRCTWWEWSARDGWNQHVVPYPIAAYNRDTQLGGIATWFVWSAKDVCGDTRPVAPYGNLGLAPTENRLLAAIVADRACGFAQYANTGAAIRTQGRYDKSFLWRGPGTPNRDFRCWKIPDPPAAVPGQPEPELTPAQQACRLSRGANNIDPPAPPAPPPTGPTIFKATLDTADAPAPEGGDGTGADEPVAAPSDAPAEDEPPGDTAPTEPAPAPTPVTAVAIDTRIPVDAGYTIEYISDLVAPGALAGVVPGASGELHGAEVVAAFGGAYAIVRTRDATGAIVVDAAGVSGIDDLAGVDTWGPIVEAEGAAIDAVDPPSASSSGSASGWMSAYTGAAADPNDPFFGVNGNGHPGGADPVRGGTPSPAHSGGAHATSTGQHTTPGARPTAYTGSTAVPGGQPTSHATYRPPSATPWTRPRPTAAVATDVVQHLQAEHSRAAAQLRGANDVVNRERTALRNVNDRVTTAAAAVATARTAFEADPTSQAKAQDVVRATLEHANQVGQRQVREAAVQAAEAAQIEAVRNERLAKVTHQLEQKMQELELAEAGGQINQNLRTQARELAAERDLAETLASGQSGPGLVARLGALAGRLAAESPVNEALPQAVRDRIANHRQWKVHHLTSIPAVLIAAIPAIVTGGMAAAVGLLGLVAFHAWRAVYHHVSAEALNRGAAPSALPDPSGGLPPGGTTPGGGTAPSGGTSPGVPVAPGGTP